MSTGTTELPTEPGVYRGREGAIYLLSSTSRVWRKLYEDFSGLYDGIYMESHMLDQLPLVGFFESVVPEEELPDQMSEDEIAEMYSPEESRQIAPGAWGVAMFGDTGDVILCDTKVKAANCVQSEYGDVLVRFLGGRWVEVM